MTQSLVTNGILIFMTPLYRLEQLLPDRFSAPAIKQQEFFSTITRLLQQYYTIDKEETGSISLFIPDTMFHVISRREDWKKRIIDEYYSTQEPSSFWGSCLEMLHLTEPRMTLEFYLEANMHFLRATWDPDNHNEMVIFDLEGEKNEALSFYREYLSKNQEDRLTP